MFKCLTHRPTQGLVPWVLCRDGPAHSHRHLSPPLQVLLQTSPYHVDSLLQLSDACRFQEDQEMARDLIGEAAPRPAAQGPVSLHLGVSEAGSIHAVP